MQFVSHGLNSGSSTEWRIHWTTLLRLHPTHTPHGVVTRQRRQSTFATGHCHQRAGLPVRRSHGRGTASKPCGDQRNGTCNPKEWGCPHLLRLEIGLV